jgi:antirestriction protein ArdC
MNNDDVRKRVVEQITSSLAKGIIPWTQPWTGRWPTNLNSGKRYRGINVILLSCSGFTDHRFLTFNQVKALGGGVAKGSKLNFVVFADHRPKKKQDEDAEQDYYFLYRVFPCIVNLEQTTGLLTSDGGKLPTLDELLGRKNDPVQACENIVRGIRANVKVELGPRAAYYPMLDVVEMPYIGDFTSVEEYYSTLFHEIMHATETRCGVPQGRENYAYNELRADLGAAMLCSYAGLQYDIKNTAAYVDGWRRRIGEDPRLIMTASREAMEGVEYILHMNDAETTAFETAEPLALAA